MLRIMKTINLGEKSVKSLQSGLGATVREAENEASRSLELHLKAHLQWKHHCYADSVYHNLGKSIECAYHTPASDLRQNEMGSNELSKKTHQSGAFASACASNFRRRASYVEGQNRCQAPNSAYAHGNIA
jgi:hypothetical protein